MKNIQIIISFAVCLISFSCSDSFDPKAPFKEQYVLNCIIRGDSVMQVALLEKTYDVTGFDPSTNNIDPSVTGAQIFIKYKGQIYQMRDSSITRTDTSRYKGPIKFYYTNNFIPSFRDSIEITAIPKDGMVLSSRTRVPNGVLFKYYPTYITPDASSIGISWSESDLGDFYLPRLKIIYTKRNEIPAAIYTMEIPVAYNVIGGVTSPIYPVVSQAPGLNYQRNIVDDYMHKVSAGDNKDNYQFFSLQLDLLIFDQFLAGYISTTNSFLDNLSIRLDEPNYTNINGGLGIFGAYIYSNMTIGFSTEYLLMLGYTP